MRYRAQVAMNGDGCRLEVWTEEGVALRLNTNHLRC